MIVGVAAQITERCLTCRQNGLSRLESVRRPRGPGSKGLAAPGLLGRRLPNALEDFVAAEDN